MYHFTKRVIDLFVSLLLVVILAPILLLIMILLILNRQNPFFFQFRVGHNGKLIRIIKFKTMNNRCDSNGVLLPDEQRLTSMGSFLRRMSLDELPQLFNVIRGNLSLIGPRPLLVDYLPLYNTRQARRHNVKPGITGWAQVNGRNSITWEQKFEYDIFYVNNRSFWLDVKIFFLTIIKVLRREGISQDGQVTMERFRGSK
jgi:lipopolysaccharide/colanic/teichoic acid biosynthesis glycosyltransferase